MVFALIISSVPVNGFAEELNKAKKESTQVSTNEASETVEPKEGEIIEQRTENSKVFYNGDGSYTKKIYFEPIHKKEKGDKVFEEISTSLVDDTKNTNEVEAENTIIEPTFYKKMSNGKYASFSLNGNQISYSILEASGNEMDAVKAKDVKAKYKKKDNKILHQGIFPK